MADAHEYAEELARFAERTGLTIAVAESLTCGKLSATLGAAPNSAEWLRGGLVAYSSEVKRDVLGVPDVPVVSEKAARAMAAGVRKLLGADLAIAVTGVGGPDDQDGEPAGSVWFAVDSLVQQRAEHRQFEGGPEQVLAHTIEFALRMLLTAASHRVR
ncbi:CinA family protein [Nocardia sp. NPDC050406]|uniref:CinA family protein n=1 Tax=Nocardia sp. NPDC050406 TaxID=3364318 RepID=UPI0037A0DD90